MVKSHELVPQTVGQDQASIVYVSKIPISPVLRLRPQSQDLSFTYVAFSGELGSFLSFSTFYLLSLCSTQSLPGTRREHPHLGTSSLCEADKAAQLVEHIPQICSAFGIVLSPAVWEPHEDQASTYVQVDLGPACACSSVAGSCFITRWEFVPLCLSSVKLHAYLRNLSPTSFHYNLLISFQDSDPQRQYFSFRFC